MTETRVQNAMTVDVEDYFHVSVFDGVIPRRRWDGFESRVVPNTERLLRLNSSRLSPRSTWSRSATRCSA